LNRNIFRAFKRELKTIYNNHIGEGALAEDKDIYKSKFIQTVDSFTESIVKECGVDSNIYNEFDVNV